MIAWIYAQRLVARGERGRARRLAEIARGDCVAVRDDDKVGEVDAWLASALEVDRP